MAIKTLSEFITHLQDLQSHIISQGRPDPEIYIGVSNASIGPSAVVSIREGSDWDSGRVILCPERRLSYTAELDRKLLEEDVEKHLLFIKCHGGHFRDKDSVYKDAFKEGVRYGMTKLEETNKLGQ